MKIVPIGKTGHLCKIQKHRWSKQLSLSVRDDGSVRLSIPRWCSYREAQKFLKSKEEWILKNVSHYQNRGTKSILNLGTREDYLENKEDARTFVRSRVEHFNTFYGFEYKGIAIRNQKTRWGSCSQDGNLNFNYRIIFLTGQQADYLIVHELCHLKHLNHSKAFWDCVAKTIPNHRKMAKILRNL